MRQARLIIMCFPQSTRKPKGKGKHKRDAANNNASANRAGNGSPPPDAPSASYGLLNSVRALNNATDPTPLAAGTGNEHWWSTQHVDVDQTPRINMAVWLHQKVVDLHNYEQVRSASTAGTVILELHLLIALHGVAYAEQVYLALSLCAWIYL